MTLVGQKFGGSSVGDPERIRNVARRVVSTAAGGADVCVAVSAMGQTTDELLALAGQVSAHPQPRELDMLLTAGERISIALLSMAINDLGREAVSFTGSQAGIVTDTSHGKAKILEMRTDRVREALDAGKIAIVAGYQGVSSTTSDITTLGRGGTDTTAVALAAALGADACEIYTDVAGVFTADPRIVPGARMRRQVSYEEMLELAASGARVLVLRSVEYARNHGVKIHVRSSFTAEDGTWVAVGGAGLGARVSRPLRGGCLDGDVSVQSVSGAGRTDVSFTLPRGELGIAGPILS